MAAAECTAAASTMQASDSVDRTSDEEPAGEEGKEDEDEEEEEGGEGTAERPRKARPAPLDIAAAQNANSAGPVTPNSVTPKTPRPSKMEKKIGHRRVDIEGQITYKKIQTSQIMGSIQLGISHAVGGLASKPERDVLMQDFAVVETISFPNQGSSLTPAHHYADFKFKTYAPVAFRYFRDLFNIQPDDFLLSMCNDPMRELSNPGASGSIFYVTADDEFIIKTVQHKEGEFLQKLLPGYYMNLNQNPRTLLPKFFGLYCYQCGGKNVRLAVMDNLLPSSIKIHQKYDLKGSTYKRKAAKLERSKPCPTYKDLDFKDHHPEGILLETETYNALIKTIQRDCRVLASFKIMDYSLLVGIHNLDRARRERLEQRKEALHPPGEQTVSGPGTSEVDGISPAGSGPGLSRSRSINRQRLVAHSSAMEAIQADTEPVDEEEDVPIGIPARNAKGERLYLFLGIIDILQSYRLKKKLEHTWKSMLHDGDTVSVHRPGFYAERFQNFMGEVVFKKIPSPLKHSPSRKKSVSTRYRPVSETEAADEKDVTVTVDNAGPSDLVGQGADRRAGAVTSKSDSPSRVAFNFVCGSTSTSLPFPPSNSTEPDIGASTNVVASASNRASSACSVDAYNGKVSSASGSGQKSSQSSCQGVLQGKNTRITKSKVPPPVPPRSLHKILNHNSAVVSQSGIPAFSTPPPSFEEVLQNADGSPIVSTTRITTESILSTGARPHQTNDVFNPATMELPEVTCISHMALKTESLLSTHSESSSTTSSGVSSFVRTCTWTPPHSVEGSTPTHTEGTPSFTESSSSGDLGCPTTPVKSVSVVKDQIMTKSSVSSGLKLYQETEM